jgi:hypothetical protein
VAVDVSVAGQSVGEQRTGRETPGHEPGPDAPDHLYRLAQEERQLLVARGQLPNAQHQHQHACLPDTQIAFTGFEKLPHDQATLANCCW